jgi:hypothetical protein
VSSGRSNACIPLTPRIDKNLGNPRGEKGVGPYACGSYVDMSFIHQQWSAREENLGAAVSQGTAGPRMCRLSPWTLLITAPEAVVGRFLGSVSPSTLSDRCGRPTPCHAMHRLC